MTPRQKRFCEEYLVDLNGSAAAIRAGYSEAGAKKQAHEILSKPDVKAWIAARAKKSAEKMELKAENVLAELMRLGFVDVAGAFDESGRLKPVHEMPEDVRRAISSIEVVEDHDGDIVKKVRFWDKPKSLELLGKNLKLFVEKIEVTPDSDFARLLSDALARTSGAPPQ